MSVEDTHVVYWIRKQSSTDVKTDGYVGVSKDFKTRLAKHWFDAEAGSSLVVHKGMRKYRDTIKISVLSSGDEEFCYALENLLRPVNNVGWNLAIGGDIVASNTGRLVSEATRAKFRALATGRIRTEASKAKYARSMTGRNLWENSAANKYVWKMADKFYLWVKDNPGRSSKAMAKAFNIENCNPWKLLDKLRSGWNPKEDPAWLAFKEN